MLTAPSWLCYKMAVIIFLSAILTVVVSQDGSGQFNGRDERPIQAAIDEARKSGGGGVIIKPGEYLIRTDLKIRDATNLTVRGTPGAVLRLPPLANAETTEAAAAGEAVLRVSNTEGFTNGMQLHIKASGKIHPFTQKPAPYFNAKVARIEPGRLVLKVPLEFSAPPKTRLYPEDSPNIFLVGGRSETITIEKLTLEGGRRASDPEISGHNILCGVFAAGPYSYEKGLLGPPIRGLVVRACVIRHCYGRGVAMYALAGSVVERCTIEDTIDEAIDFDHFAVGCRAVSNTVARCGEGMELNDANDCLVMSNRFDSCGVGINLWRWCHQEELNVRNVIANNTFVNTRRSVVLLQSKTTSNTARGNVIRGCGGAGIIVNGLRQMIASNVVTQAQGGGIIVAGNDNDVISNRCYDNGKVGGVTVKGANNRLRDNVERAP